MAIGELRDDLTLRDESTPSAESAVLGGRPVSLIRERMLVQLRPKEGEIVRVRVEMTPAGVYTYIKVNWKSEELLVTLWSSDQPKTYKTISRAIEHAYTAYGFTGPFYIGKSADN